MKRIMLLLCMAALLAVPAVCAADGVGVGVVPSATVKLNEMATAGDMTTFILSQGFGLKQGALSFTVEPVDPNDVAQGMTMNGRIEFAVSATVTTNGYSTTVSNLVMNFSGLLLNADRTRLAAISTGTVNGTLTCTNVDGTFDPGFTGSYSLKTTLAWVNDQPVSGTISPLNVIISGVTEEDNTDPENPVTVPVPVIASVAFPPIPFKFVSGDGVVPGGTADVNGIWTATYVAADLSCGGTATFNLNQTGSVITGTKYDNQDNECSDTATRQVTGAVTGNNVTLRFTSGVGTNIIITGILNADGTVSGTVKNSSGVVLAKWGAARNGSAPVGVTGTWSGTDHENQTNGDYPITFVWNQYGNIILGMVNGGGPLTGAVSGKTVTFTCRGDLGDKVTGSGAISGTMVDGAYPSGTTASGVWSSPSTSSSGTWNVTKEPT